jgi:hypothetical protein
MFEGVLLPAEQVLAELLLLAEIPSEEVLLST